MGDIHVVLMSAALKIQCLILHICHVLNWCCVDWDDEDDDLDDDIKMARTDL